MAQPSKARLTTKTIQTKKQPQKEKREGWFWRQRSGPHAWKAALHRLTYPQPRTPLFFMNHPVTGPSSHQHKQSYGFQKIERCGNWIPPGTSFRDHAGCELWNDFVTANHRGSLSRGEALDKWQAAQEGWVSGDTTSYQVTTFVISRLSHPSPTKHIKDSLQSSLWA